MAAQYRPFRINLYYPPAAALLWASLLCWISVHVLGIGVQDSIMEGVVFTALLGGSALLSFNALRFYSPRIDRLLLVTVAASVASLAVVWIEGAVLGLLPLEANSSFAFEQLWWIRFAFALCINAAALLLGMHWNQLSDEQNIQEKLADTARLAREAELFKLRHQLQPHFLFNSLNSINALITSEPVEARKMVQQLSAFLRGSIGTDEKDLVSFGDELDHIGLYLNIEKVRFGHRLATEVGATDEAKAAMIPPLLLQPLMENAIKFGLYGTTEAVNIKLEASIEKGYLVIQLSNPVDEDAHIDKGTGFGLASVHRRLFLIFGRTDLLTTAHTNTTFTAHLRIPQRP